MAKNNLYYSPVNSNNTNNSVSSLFESRKYYINTSIPYITGTFLEPTEGVDNLSYDPNSDKSIKKNKIPLADLYNDNGFYGCIDNDGDVVVPNANPSSISLANSVNGKKLYLQNFVWDAFVDMREYLNKQILHDCYNLRSAAIGQNNINSVFYNIQVKKAYSESTNIDKIYSQTMMVISQKFKEYCKVNNLINSKITDGNSFIKQYIPFLKQHLFFGPVTKSRNVTFYNLKTFNNTLSFSISDDPSGNFQLNYEKYYLDVGFYTYAKSCIRFGFRVDKNNPFIIYPDLRSPAFKPYLEKYNLSNDEEMFSTRFKKVFYYDLETLKLFFYYSYSNFIFNNENYIGDISNMSICDIKNNNIYKRENIKYEDFISKIPESYWFRIYVYLKNYELKANLTQQKFEYIVSKGSEYLKINKPGLALEQIKKHFDETSGSIYFDSLQLKNNMLQEERLPEVINEIII